jgi:hypothetical protein
MSHQTWEPKQKHPVLVSVMGWNNCSKFWVKFDVDQCSDGGQGTKLKLINRKRYGQAGFDLLRRCTLLS